MQENITICKCLKFLDHSLYGEEKTAVVWPRQEDAREEKEKRTLKENMDKRSTSSHDSKKFRTRSMEKQRGMEFGFRKTATDVKNTGLIDRKIFE
jgi:hypothetical protein